MAATDNKLLDGAGVAKLSQLIKEEIAQGGGSSYTAGAGIEIDDNNEISVNIPSELILFLLQSGFSNGTTPSPLPIYISSINDIETAMKLHKPFTVDTVGGKNISESDLYNLGIGVVYQVGDYNFTTGQSAVNNTIIITSSSTGNVNFARYSYSIVVSPYIYTYSNAANMRYAFTRMLVDSIVYKSNFANFSGFRLSSYFDGIDSALTQAKALATTETAGRVKPDGTTITIDSNGVISSQGGSSLPTDPSTDGVYKLVNTVETEGGVQTATQSWEEDTGGGGATYTAGSGIGIENDVIYAKSSGSDFVFKQLLALLEYTSYGNLDTISGLIDHLLAGGAYKINSSASNKTASQTLMDKLAVNAIITLNENGTYTKENRFSRYTFEKGYIYAKVGGTLVRATDGNAYILLNNLKYQNTTSGLTATTIKGAIDEVAASIATRIPPCPTTADGNYVLKCTVSSGTPTYSWVAEA